MYGITLGTCEVIYILKCAGGLMYVGKTRQQLKNSDFRIYFKCHQKTGSFLIAKHFLGQNRTICCLRFQGIEKVNHHR